MKTERILPQHDPDNPNSPNNPKTRLTRRDWAILGVILFLALLHTLLSRL